MARPKRQKLKLAIDFGGSTTKVNAAVEDKAIALVMSPEAIEIDVADADDYRQSDELDLKHRCFVGAGGRYFAVGDLAVRSGATQALKRPKGETAVYKVLAVVAILTQRLGLAASFDLELGCLLPPGEFADRQRLQDRLVAALADFDTPLGGMSVRVGSVQFYPEGLGIAHLYYLNRPQTEVLGVIVAGHRNISCYAMQGKQVVHKATCDLGFQSWIAKIVDRTSGYEIATLAPVVAQYWAAKDEAELIPVLRYTDPIERELELKRLIKAIESTQLGYWRAIGDWLDDKLPSAVEEVMLSGGTADVLSKDFIDYLTTRLPPRTDCGNRAGIFDARAFKLLPTINIPDGYRSRFADVYCLFQYLMKSTTRTRS